MKKIIFLMLPLFLLQRLSYSQDHFIVDSLQEVLKASKEDTAKVPVLINICKEKWKYAEYAEAKKYADDALSLSEKINFQTGIADAYCQIGIVFWYVKDNQRALEYHQKALLIYEQSGNKTGIADVYNRMGHDYADMPDYPKALECFQHALQLDEQLNNQLGISKNLDLIGYVYMYLSDYPRALTYYFKSLKVAEAIGNKRSISALGHDIGALYEKQNNLAEAYKYASKGLSLALEIGEMHLIEEAYTGLEAIYLKMHNYKEAFYTRLKYDEIEMSLRNIDNAGKIKQMQMQYDFDKKQVSDSLKSVQEKEIGDMKLQKQKALSLTGILGIVVSIILLFFVYRNYYKQRIANINLKAAQEQLIKSEKMAAFGVMATRVAHEIRNPLNFVNNFSVLSQEMVDDVITSTTEEEKKKHADVLKANLQKIDEHGKRLAGIIKELQDQSNKGTAHKFFEEE